MARKRGAELGQVIPAFATHRILVLILVLVLAPRTNGPSRLRTDQTKDLPLDPPFRSRESNFRKLFGFFRWIRFSSGEKATEGEMVERGVEDVEICIEVVHGGLK